MMDNDLRYFIERTKAHMNENLETKTGWGRNEVKRALEDAMSQALIDIMERKGEEK